MRNESPRSITRRETQKEKIRQGNRGIRNQARAPKSGPLSVTPPMSVWSYPAYSSAGPRLAPTVLALTGRIRAARPYPVAGVVQLAGQSKRRKEEKSQQGERADEPSRPKGRKRFPRKRVGRHLNDNVCIDRAKRWQTIALVISTDSRGFRQNRPSLACESRSHCDASNTPAPQSIQSTFD